MDDQTLTGATNDSAVNAAAAPRSANSARKSIWLVVKWTLTVVVLAFVVVRAMSLWRENSTEEVTLHWGWLALAGLFYSLGWLPSVWYFRLLLARMGDQISWPAAMRAYYCGHLGKYVPGKAMVPLIRGQMVAAAGGRFRAGALAVVYETLVMMGVGFEISLAFFPFLIPEHLADQSALVQRVLAFPPVMWLLDRPAVLPLATLAAVVLTLPLVAWLFSYAAAWLAPRANGEELASRIDAGLIGRGALVFVVAWLIHGLALWASLRGIGADVSIMRLPTWTVCVALPMTAGFLAIFAPGGVGVREGVMIEILKVQPGIDARGAIAAAFLLRAVGFVAEVIVAIVLYYGLASHARPRSSPDGE